MEDQDRDAGRLELIIQLIDALDRRLSQITSEKFVANGDEIDLTSYRLSVIGEECNKLSQTIKGRHDLPWQAIYGLRNVVAHNYLAIDPERIWIAATENLAALHRACIIELVKFDI